jgi:hypothetical protein
MFYSNLSSTSSESCTSKALDMMNMLLANNQYNVNTQHQITLVKYWEVRYCWRRLKQATKNFQLLRNRTQSTVNSILRKTFKELSFTLRRRLQKTFWIPCSLFPVSDKSTLRHRAPRYGNSNMYKYRQVWDTRGPGRSATSPIPSPPMTTERQTLSVKTFLWSGATGEGAGGG